MFIKKKFIPLKLSCTANQILIALPDFFEKSKMNIEKSISLSKPSFTAVSRLKDYGLLIKFRLSSLVVFSAAMGFLLASQGSVNWSRFFLLIIGGFFVTGSSNGFNQIIERNLDKLMDRTSGRPLPDKRISVNEALIVSCLLGISGIYILWQYMNPLSGFLGLFALLSYTLAYTPLKRITPFSVFVGAIPGAIPAMLGYVAVSGTINMYAMILFCIQFIWQFPHFWAIAWVLDDDYKKAGFEMLPSKGGRDKKSAMQAVIYTFSLIPVGLMPYFFHMTGIVSAIIISITAAYFLYQSIQLFRTCSIKSAQQLMFGSFIYLPVVMIAMVCDKI
jgi:protoheme IX farnesyltransferase